MYQVLARKWRPQVFEELVGQQTVSQTLQNAIILGRIAHAFLFSGPRGVGKTTCARILAKALNCHSSDGPVVQPCNRCPSCEDIAASRSMDVLEIDGASNRGIDEVRELRESAKYQPIRDRFRIFIIDEVHMLTTEAFNALLKTLEEPPPHVFFIFATTERNKVPPTIVSRCQLYDFKRISDRVLVQRLKQITEAESIDISDKGLNMIAAASEGGLRDALGTLDQIVAFGGSTVNDKDLEAVLGLIDIDVMIDLAEAIAAGDAGRVLAVLEDRAQYGLDYKVFYRELLSFYRDLFFLRFSAQPEGMQADNRLRKLASGYDEIQLLRICQQLVSIQSLIKLSGNLRFLFEITLVKLSQIKRLVPLEEIAQSLKKNSSLKGEIPAAILPYPASRANSRETLSREEMSVRTAPPAEIQPARPAGQAKAAVSDDFFALLITDLERQNPRLAAALENARVLRADSKISFYVPETFFKMMKLDARDQQDLELLVAQRLGADVKVEIHRGEPPAEKEARKVATPQTLVENDPLVQEFVKNFKARIGKIDLDKGAKTI